MDFCIFFFPIKHHLRPFETNMVEAPFTHIYIRTHGLVISEERQSPLEQQVKVPQPVCGLGERKKEQFRGNWEAFEEGPLNKKNEDILCREIQ